MFDDEIFGCGERMAGLLLSLIFFPLAAIVYKWNLKKTNEGSLHFRKYQFYALCDLNEKCLQKLLNHLSLLDPKNVGCKDSSFAVTKVFENNEKTVKGLLLNEIWKEKRDFVYDYKNQKFLDGIDTSKLDTTAITNILLTVESFPTFAKKIPTKNKDNSQTGCCIHKCCKDCIHNSCEHKRKKVKCPKECPDKCNACDSSYIICKERRYICCQKCETCMPCTLNNNDCKDRHELFAEKLEDVCPSLKLRLSIGYSRIFRNMTCHLTESECEEMEKGNFILREISEDPKSYKDLLTLFQKVIEQIIDCVKPSYAKFATEISKDLQHIIMADNKSKLDPFATAINAMFKLDEMSKRLSRIEDAVKDSLKVEINYIRSKVGEFELDSSEAQDIEEILQKGVESYLGGGCRSNFDWW